MNSNENTADSNTDPVTSNNSAGNDSERPSCVTEEIATRAQQRIRQTHHRVKRVADHIHAQQVLLARLGQREEQSLARCLALQQLIERQRAKLAGNKLQQSKSLPRKGC